ncbi:hypothetical protein T03_9453 [Trichinella britovi]|uniref:Uncharacterized protein n=1 Tax=Trichinella britovi TaxID=45882 RepID=A0A0V1BMS0_TRIBR|nr:hypothetical protein T03_9453 [Trichinella britovi]
MFPAYNVFPLSTSVFSGPQMNVLTGFYCQLVAATAVGNFPYPICIKLLPLRASLFLAVNSMDFTGMVPLGLNSIPIRAHCSFIGRCPRYFIIGR